MLDNPVDRAGATSCSPPIGLRENTVDWAGVGWGGVHAVSVMIGNHETMVGYFIRGTASQEWKHFWGMQAHERTTEWHGETPHSCWWHSMNMLGVGNTSECTQACCHKLIQGTGRRKEFEKAECHCVSQQPIRASPVSDNSTSHPSKHRQRFGPPQEQQQPLIMAHIAMTTRNLLMPT